MNEQGYRVGVGASSVLMIFVVLSLTTISVLSFATARVNATLTSRRVAQVERYYASAAEAQRAVSVIDTLLLEAPEDTEAYAAYVRGMELPGFSLAVSDDLLLSFIVPCGETQQLEIAVQANGPNGTTRYTMVQHRLVNIAEWEPENSWDLP